MPRPGWTQEGVGRARTTEARPRRAQSWALGQGQEGAGQAIKDQAGRGRDGIATHCVDKVDIGMLRPAIDFSVSFNCLGPCDAGCASATISQCVPLTRSTHDHIQLNILTISK